MPYRYLTISVDDGFPDDSKAADLLHKYGLQATFYLPARNPERAVMPPSQVRELSLRFEIGGHTYNHAPLAVLPDETARMEICDGKKWLEDLLGKPAVSFCYPRGKFNRRTPTLVKQAGFLGARTCLFNLHDIPENPFLWGLSTHACNHSPLIQVRHALLERNFAGLRNFCTVYKGASHWQAHFFHGLRYVEQHGGVVHLYFHSWEVGELGQWQLLDSVLHSAAQHALTPVTNGMLFQHWEQLRRGVQNFP